MVPRETHALLCFFFMNYSMFHIEPSCWVDVGGMASHKGVSKYGVWAILSTSSLLAMIMCVL